MSVPMQTVQEQSGSAKLAGLLSVEEPGARRRCDAGPRCREDQGRKRRRARSC
jgi:hypothetical protein